MLLFIKILESLWKFLLKTEGQLLDSLWFLVVSLMVKVAWGIIVHSKYRTFN